MEDVDEGFGSNESNYCNADKEELLNDLKYLNGQKVIDKETGLDKIFRGKVCENGNRVIGNGQVIDREKNGSDNDLVLRNDKASEEHEEPSVDLSFTDNKTLSSASENLHEETALKLEKEILKSDDLGSQNDFPNHNGNSRESFVCSDALESAFQSNCPEKEFDKNEHKSINGHSKDDLNRDEEYLNKELSNEINSSNKTPLKQPTSSAEGERSPFLLDDKVRNSLKGLVAKVKSSELSREGCSPTGSSVSSDSGLATPSKTQENIDKEKNEKDVEVKQTQTKGMDTVDEDEDILADDEDGIPMEIGSESEDELLDLYTEKAPDKECCDKETDLNLASGSSNDKSSIESRLQKAEQTKSPIPVEITSDTKENAENASRSMKNEIRHDSVEKMQFEDDSNSNGSSGRINDIVDFLNHDLSRTNSPLTTNDNLKNNAISRRNNQEIQEEIDERDLKDTQEGEIKKNVTDKAETGCHAKNDDVVICSTKECEVKINDSNSIKDDKPSIQTSPLVEELLTVENNSVVEENSEKENLSCKLEFKESVSGRTELVTENKVDDEDDDDVIFEGATMPEMRNEFQRRTVSNNIFLKSVKDNAEEEESKSKINTKGDDDDVIFEKEIKAESVGPKQNCDNEKANSSAIDLKEKTESAHGPPDNDSKNYENKTSAIISNDEKVLEKTTSNTSRNSADRKRSAEEKDIVENDSKRSKLDLTGLIGRLGSRVEPARIEVLDTDEEDEKCVITESAENEIPIPTESTDKKKEKENKNLITVTDKELEDLVREKVKQYLTSQRDTLVAKLSQKVKELQQNNDLWKRQVKDLQVKVNDVTVLQQKLEKRKAATAALRQITTRNVAVQVDEGRKMSAHAVLKQMLAMKMKEVSPPSSRNEVDTIVQPLTSSSKNTKGTTTSPKVTAQVPFVSTPSGTGTIRLPIPQSSVTPALTTQLTPGSKVVTTTYQTPSVKSLLDTTRVQKTVGSVPSAATTSIGTSVIGLLQYPPQTYMAKPTTSQGFVQQTVTQVVTPQVSTAVAKPVTLTSPNATKVIDLTDDDDTMKTRLVALQPSLNTVTNQQAVRHVIAPPGTQFVRAGLPNQQTYQLVLTSPPAAIRPGMMVTMAAAVSPATSIIQAVPQSQQTLVTPSPAVAPGTTLARAAVPSSPVTKAPVCSHPAPFPVLPQQQTAGLKGLPPKPSLKISRVSQGIVLSWNMSLNDSLAEISNYQLFAYQETSAQPVATLWKKVGDVKALPLPMACTLTQFQVGNKYHFAVRAMDVHNRVGQFSDPGSIHLTPNTST